MSENIWRGGERISSGVRGSVTDISNAGVEASSNSLLKMASKSVRKVEKTGAWMLRVGEKTMQTFRTLILLTLELLTMLMRNSESARIRVQFASGSFRTRILKAAIFLDFSSRSISYGSTQGTTLDKGIKVLT